jgi:hypothetical protein
MFQINISPLLRVLLPVQVALPRSEKLFLPSGDKALAQSEIAG